MILKLLVRLLAAFVLAAGSASADTFPLPAEGVNLVGDVATIVTRDGDTLAAIARRKSIGSDALRRANPDVDAWLPEPGTEVRLPSSVILPAAPREGIVVNLSERRLYYFDRENGRLLVHPVGIGVDNAPTPLGVTRTVAKIEEPTWTPPPSIRAEHLANGEVLPRVVPPGPDNPLGRFAIKLASPGMFIHGTNRPIGVGRAVSHGCLRLYDDHIAELIRHVPNGTSVQIVDEPYKAAWKDGVLYLESHRRDETDFTGAIRAIVGALDEAPRRAIDWDKALEVARTGSGLPEPISTST